MKLHKKEIAKRQIDTAIELFLAGKDYLSVVTLAGSGEEILGQLLVRHSKKNTVDYLKELDRRLSGGREFKIVNQEINGFRNSLKHANDEEEDEISVAEGQEHAIAMLARAINNYALFEERVSKKMAQFLQWLRDNRSDLFEP
jgi:hypothetical protein